MGFLGELGAAIQGIGSTIWDGIKTLGSGLMNNVISPIGDFLSRLPTMISSGFDWVKDTVSNMFSGNVKGTVDSVRAAVGNTPVEMSNSGITEFLVFGSDGSTLSSGADAIANATTPAITDMASKAATLTSNNVKSVAPNITIEPPVSQTPAAGGVGGKAADTGDLFSKSVDFFKTDVGQFVGKSAMTALAIQYQNNKNKAALKAAKAEAQRQEEEKRRQWLTEQQRATELKSWEAQRANEQALAQQRNAWSSFTGKWQQPTTVVPSPHF